MRNFYYALLTFGILLLCASCNKEEGLGGSSAIQGYVYHVVHQHDVYSLAAETIPAVGERVYIVYGDNENGPVATRDVRTNKNGMYHFEYLREGNYVVYALSSYPQELNNLNAAELKHVKVGSGTANAPHIYIHSGRGYGLSMIRGKVMAQYYERGILLGNPIAPAGERVYLKRAGESYIYDDVRVSDDGYFVFMRVPPGEYEVYTVTQYVGFRRPTYPTESQKVNVTEPHRIYDLPEVFNIILNR